VAEGEGAFYGPKVDFHFRDAIGRLWQLTTVQCDFALPERFEMAYMGEDNERHRPVMIHRAILGTIERFTAVLIEHYAGAFPLWLAPVQVVVATITSDADDYARKVAEEVADHDADLGILVCGSGIGMSIVANKVAGVRAANVSSEYEAQLSREHNDANVLTLGARLISDQNAFQIVQKWLETPFAGGRHQRRVEKISEIEREEMKT